MSLISFWKLTVVTAIAITTVACSSGGHHSSNSNSSPTPTEQTAAEKAAAEKAAAEKAAAEKAAAEKAAAEKAAVEKAAAEKAAAEKAAAEKAAAEKAAAEKAAAEKAAAEKAAAEKAAAEKAAAEKAAAEKAAAEKAAAEKAAAEKAAAEKAAAEKAAAEKAAAEKLAREDILYKRALSLGLTADRAKDVATTQSEKTAAEQNIAIDSAALNQAKQVKDKLVNNDYGQSWNHIAKELSYKQINESSLNDKDQYSQRKGSQRIYQQPYSMTVGTWILTDIKDDINQLVGKDSIYNVDVVGFATQAVAMPSEGKATYSGLAQAWNGDDLTLRYNVDFGKRTGSGSLLKATEYGGRILLDEGTISNINLKGNHVIGINSSAKGVDGTSGSYSLGFYGTQAQEVAGSVEMNKDSYRTNVNGKNEISIAGTRGEISK